MNPEDFITRYERALASQQWSAVDPLIHKDASVTFSNGSVHKGKDAVRRAFEKNFSALSGEKYQIENVHWVSRTKDFAVYLFDFRWSGMIDGKSASGSGRGTSVLTCEGGEWKLLVEHLGPAPR
ncbi:MAG: YybH family protein [Burkholderiaceae bacterium]